MSPAINLTRRTLLVAGGAGSALALAACAPDATNPASGSPDAGTATPTEVATLTDIPVGGAQAVMLNGSQIIVSQPTEGTVVAFSAICTHKGCPVQPQQEGLACPCHGSLFDTATGAVLTGPATEPLPPVKVTLNGDKVMAG